MSKRKGWKKHWISFGILDIKNAYHRPDFLKNGTFDSNSSDVRNSQHEGLFPAKASAFTFGCWLDRDLHYV